ncbi:hypothetical protein ACIPW9_28745 [Streptomyces sp. NPDC090052]|nr:hypothetical protein [Streptomyces sp. NBC_01306]MCX4728831.1 hypothetical protein [Streptomyces sp. NBC_01306]WSX46445.1 hypothetical protein OG760_34720 [Streptomyces sp. NBC_00963]
MNIFLETDRLVLRAFTEADVDHLLALDIQACDGESGTVLPP